MNPRPLVVTGAVAGLTWAAALRGWMVHLTGDASAFHWYATFGLVLAPGLGVGALLGLAEHRRRTGGTRRWWLTLSPCLFLAALTDPTIFKELITRGTGGGSIAVVVSGLAAGFALSGRGRARSRRTCGTFAVLGVLLMLGPFLGLLLPGAVIGALTASAEYRRWTGTVPQRSRLIWSPLLLAAVLQPSPLDIAHGSDRGIALAALAVPAVGMLGGYAIAGRGPRRARGLSAPAALSTMPIWAMTSTRVGGTPMSLGDPHGAWAAVLYWSLLATFAVAAAIPHRSAAVSRQPGAAKPVTIAAEAA